QGGKIVGTGATGVRGGKEEPKSSGSGKLVGTGVKADQFETTGSAKTNLDQVARARFFDTATGSIVLFAVPGAAVKLTPVIRNRKGTALSFTLTEQNNTLTLSKLQPGSYLLSATHPDYKSREETITIGKGEVKPISDFLLPKYGEIVIGGAPEGSTITLDGKTLDPTAYKLSPVDGKVTIGRVLEGEHELGVAKPAFDPWRMKIKVEPGKSNPASAQLRLATIDLTVRSKAGARVYLNNSDRGAVQPDGALVVRDLLPGTYQMRVALDGFENLEQPVALALTERKPVTAVELTPIAESNEGNEDFTTGSSKWIVPENWKLERRGLLISGPQVGLFRTPTEKRPYNVYRDFKMSFDIRFNNGRGASWVVRAKDERNYYMFQLLPATDGQARFNFYVCRQGECTLKDSKRYPEPLNKPADSYFVQVEAKGVEFIHRITIQSNPRVDDPQPLGTFSDDTFTYGGVGFRGIDDNQALLQNLVVIPIKVVR
ncbi:MAG: PEGA domain-containing protein, partial [Acidobacteriota bacterium]